MKNRFFSIERNTLEQLIISMGEKNKNYSFVIVENIDRKLIQESYGIILY